MTIQQRDIEISVGAPDRQGYPLYGQGLAGETAQAGLSHTALLALDDSASGAQLAVVLFSGSLGELLRVAASKGDVAQLRLVLRFAAGTEPIARLSWAALADAPDLPIALSVVVTPPL